jgi:hypothetical protein
MGGWKPGPLLESMMKMILSFWIALLAMTRSCGPALPLDDSDLDRALEELPPAYQTILNRHDPNIRFRRDCSLAEKKEICLNRNQSYAELEKEFQREIKRMPLKQQRTSAAGQGARPLEDK